MSESIAEMVIPGTYIEVRSEGLIGVGGISTGNIGIVGTAAKGPVGAYRVLGNYADAVEVFGNYDTAVQPLGGTTRLTLVRTIEQAFKGGASTVYAVRIANGTTVKADRKVKLDGGSTDAFTLTAKDPGTWGNAIKITVINETVPAPKSKLMLTYGNVTETYEGNAEEIRKAIAADSRLVDVSTVATTTGVLATIDPGKALNDAASGVATSGDDKAGVTTNDVRDGLAVLLEPTDNVNIVLVGNDTMIDAQLDVKGVVGDHLEAAENQGKERVAILGVKKQGTKTDVGDPTGEMATVANDRIVMVAPGVVYTDPGTGRPHTLPASYMAAVVAGKLASQAPHISLTNKELNVDGVGVNYSAAATKALLGARLLVVRPKFGYQVVKGITSDNGAFKQISIRRTVDYAKAGVRLGSDPYIGKLNNSRVRAALKATLDGFLSQMVLDEMLIEYELEVTATRSQEINGICAVNMTLKPTFSIDYIRVTMTLQ
jgi:hypothetical protein